MEESVEIQSRDYWFKVVEMLQQNWALIDSLPDGSFKVLFVGDTSGVFDEIEFCSLEDAVSSLKRNGFSKYIDDPKAQKFMGLSQIMHNLYCRGWHEKESFKLV